MLLCIFVAAEYLQCLWINNKCFSSLFFFFFWLMCLLQSKLLEVGAKIGAGRPHEAPLSISPYSIQVAISGGTWPLCAGRF